MSKDRENIAGAVVFALCMAGIGFAFYQHEAAKSPKRVAQVIEGEFVYGGGGWPPDTLIAEDGSRCPYEFRPYNPDYIFMPRERGGVLQGRLVECKWVPKGKVQAEAPIVNLKLKEKP